MKAADDNLSNARRSKLILLNVCVGQFIAGLDQRALLVALPTLTHRFNTSLTTIQWVLLGYDITLIGLVITVGRMGDLFGRRRIYAGGFLVFVFSSVALRLRTIRRTDHRVSRPASPGRGHDRV